jgi:cell division protein FtsQ
MARRAAANTDELPARSPKKPSGFLGTVRMAFKVFVGTFLLVGCVWAFVRVEQFVVSDKQFVLDGPPEPGVASPVFQIDGVVNASEQRIVDVFGRDFGRSVYLCPIEERRRRLLAIDWVRDASVSRIWPNRLVVRIKERTPVAFLQVTAPSGTTVYSLVDADGVMLDPRHATKLALPVLSGFPSQEAEPLRRERVKRFLRLQSELGQLMDNISEIDASDVENLKLTQQFHDRALTLMVGNQKFLQRYKNFVDNYHEIRKRLPDAYVLDLRLKDRITAVASGPPPGQPIPPKEPAR